jgi:hypothetical protein
VDYLRFRKTHFKICLTELMLVATYIIPHIKNIFSRMFYYTVEPSYSNSGSHGRGPVGIKELTLSTPVKPEITHSNVVIVGRVKENSVNLSEMGQGGSPSWAIQFLRPVWLA